MSRTVNTDTIITPDLADIQKMQPYAMYGIYSHLHILATDKTGKRETIKFTQPVDSFRHSMMAENGYRSHRHVAENGDLHIMYQCPGITCYANCTDEMDALEADGFTDVRYSDDWILLILTQDSMWRAVKRGDIKTTGA